MSATPARTITSVEAYTKAGGERRCKVTLEGGEVVALASLSRGELLRAAKIAFPDITGKAWFTVRNGEIRDAIRSGVAPSFTETSTEETVIEVVEAEAPAAPSTPAPAPVHTPGQALTPELAALVQALAALQPQAPPAEVDPAAIQAAVDKAVQAAITSLPTVTVEIKTPRGTNVLPESHHSALPEIVTIVGRGLNLFLVGPAGSGKSTIAHQAADALGLSFQALSLGPTTPTSKLFGYQDANGNYVRTPFREAYENGGVILLDELDNGHPGLVAEINQATANGYCAFADGMIRRHEDCRIIATGNTFGRGPDRLFVGRNILDAATLDRFVTVEVDVDERLERAIALGFAEGDAALESTINRWVDQVQKVRSKVLEAKLALVVSPRASIDGADLIAGGLKPDRVAEVRLFAGWSSEHRAKVK